MRRAIPILGTLLLLFVLAPGCSDDDNGTNPTTTGDFSGTWYIASTASSKTVACPPNLRASFAGRVGITQEGSTALLYLRDGQGNDRVVTLEVSGNQATGSLVTTEDTWSMTQEFVLNLQSDEVSLTGALTLTLVEDGSSCSDVANLQGVNDSVEPSGPFNGYWEENDTLLEDTCSISSVPGTVCMEFVQYGSLVVIMAGDRHNVGIVTGDTAEFSNFVLDPPAVSTATELILTVAEDESTLDGSAVMVINDAAGECSSSWDVVWTRLEACAASKALESLPFLR